ncbi:MAG: multidrug transporter ATP-binding protein [Frankiales bacterium]|nr:multidrug transporter ATP-binding protein [Frankiales bacterium]
MITVDHVTITRGKRAVVHDLCFSIGAGEIVGLLGPSGCGKTTLMRAIVGVQRGVAGNVTVLGERPGSPANRARVGYVTQAPSVYGDLTVIENLRYFAAIHRADPQGLLQQVGLANEAHALVRDLSGGQRARVSLATALLGMPLLLVLDEPTVGLDPVLRRDLWQVFRNLADSGVTLLISSHVMDEAARCDRILLMRDGRLVADAAPKALLEQTNATDIEDAFLKLALR